MYVTQCYCNFTLAFSLFVCKRQLFNSFFFITGSVYKLILSTFIQSVVSTPCKACNKPVWKIVLCGKRGMQHVDLGILSPVQTDATLLANNSKHCWMLHVASVCTPCCMLLDVVACCCAKFETGQTFQPTTPIISFVP